MAVAVLFTASCAKEDISSSIGGGEVEVTFTANLADLGTRAYGEAGHITTLHYFVYDQNGTLLDFDGDGNSTTTIKANQPAKVNLPLIKGMTYKLAFWADNGSYNIANNVVSVNYGNANDDTIDAFYALIEEFDPAKAEDQHKTSVTLYRPFAQLNALTDDFAAVQLSDVALQTSTVKVVAYTQFNVANGDVVEGAFDEIEFYATTMPCALTPAETLAGKEDYKYLSMNYILVPKAGHVSNVEFTFTGSKGVTFKDTKYDNVPFKQNYRTNILGALLTKPTEFNVEIETDFEGTIENKVVEVKTAAELNTALANPEVGTVVMQDNIETEGFVFEAPATRAAVKYAGRDIVIDGNGKTLTYKGASGGRIIDFTSATNGANLTIKNLTIINNVSWIERAINYNTNGTLTLEDVTINSAEGCSLNYAINLPGSSDNAKVEIKNCEIWAGAQALNLWGEKTVVNVTNSELYVVDDSAAEGRSVVAINNDGATIADYSVLNFIGGSINVVYVGEGETNPSYAIRNNTAHSKINISDDTVVVGAISNPVAIIYWEGFNQYYSSPDLNAALDAAVPTYKATGVRMINDLTLPLAKKAIYGTPVAVQMKNGGVFDGCNNTLSVENPVYDAYVVETYGGTIKNLNITTPAGRGIIISSPKEDIYLDNVFVNGPGYALNTTEHNGKKLVVTNSTFKGWTSLAGLESVSFTSCTFGENTYSYWQKFGYDKDYDRLIRPYVATVFDSCVFENGFYVDLSSLAASATVTLKNCECGEVEITAENYSQFITIELPAGRTLTDCVVFE